MLELDDIQGDILVGLQKYYEIFLFFKIVDPLLLKRAVRLHVISRITSARVAHRRELIFLSPERRMARGEEIPVNPQMVAWARNRAGLTIGEAAEKFTHVAAWEAGTSFPTYPQLERLADEFKLPVAAFFFPEPPTLPPIRESFRTLPDTEFDQIPRQVRFMLRKAKGATDQFGRTDIRA